MNQAPNGNPKEKDELLQAESTKSIDVCSQLFESKSSRLFAMLFLIMIYFFAEVIVGHITSSLTLIADSFHMLSDAIALIVSLFAVRMSKRKAYQSIKTWPFKHRYFNTFGWVRFGNLLGINLFIPTFGVLMRFMTLVVGALINATFLLALCLSILMEAIEKFYDPRFVSKPELVLVVGGGGLAINLVGLLMFGAHHDHDQGHDHHHQSHDQQNHHHHHSRGDASQNTKSNGSCSRRGSDVEMLRKKKEIDEAQMNMRAVFLHVLGDALGSVIVMISAAIVIFVPHDNHSDELLNCSARNSSGAMHPNHWIVYLDPLMSVILAFVMIFTTVPLFKKSSLILLQAVPKSIRLDSVREMLKKIEGVQEIHDFHIWQLAGEKLVATIHVQCIDSATYLRVAKEMRVKLHQEGIHSLTIQPEFCKASKHCIMTCPSTECRTKVCCEITTDPLQRKTSPQSAVEEMKNAEEQIEITVTENRSSIRDETIAGVSSYPDRETIL